MRHVEGAPFGTRGGISVVHTFPADGDYTFRMMLHTSRSAGSFGRTAMTVLDPRADRNLGQRRARGAARHQHADERADSERPDLEIDAADSRHGRPAARVGGVHPRFEGAGRRPDRAARAHARRRQHRLRRHHAAAPARLPRHRADQGHRRVRHAEPPPDLHLPSDDGRRGGDLRAADRRAPRAAGLSRRPARPRTSQDADEVLRSGAREGRLRGRHPRWRCRPSSPARASCSASSSVPARRAPGRPTASRHRPRLAPVVLPVGHGARRRAAHAAASTAALRTPVGAREAGAADARRPALRGAVDALRVAVAAAAGPRQDHPRLPDLSRTTTTRWRRRCGARPSCSSTASSARTAACSTCSTADYTFVNERLAQHYGIPNVVGSEFRRVQVPDEPPRPARPGQHPDADLGRRPHLAGAARQVGDGGAARHAAAGAAAERAGARRLGEGECRRQDAVGARAHGGAPHEPGVQLVPPRDRPARPGARELRRHRRVAHQGQRGARSTRSASSTTAPGWTARPACASALHEAPGRVPPQLHREA